MTQLDLLPDSKFTFDTLFDLCAEFDKVHGFVPKRLALTRQSYNELVDSLPLGVVLYAAEHGLPIFNGVEIEVFDPPHGRGPTANLTNPYYSIDPD